MRVAVDFQNERLDLEVPEETVYVGGGDGLDSAHHDVLPTRQQRAHELAADSAGGAGDDDSHLPTMPETRDPRNHDQISSNQNSAGRAVSRSTAARARIPRKTSGQ